jgi:hypothetical protein
LKASLAAYRSLIAPRDVVWKRCFRCEKYG